jgi:hypothetical protein
MQKEERQAIRENAKAKHKGNIDAAIADYLGFEYEFKKAHGIPPGCEGSFGAIRDEVERYEKADAEKSEPPVVTGG